MASVIVTGADGFIGRSLVKYLSESGYKVTGTTRNQEKNNRCNERYIDNWIECNFDDPDSIEIDKIRNSDYLIHLAGLAHVGGVLSYEKYYDINVRNTEFLLNAVAGSDLKRFVFLSSIKVNSSGRKHNINTALTESSPINPDDAYGKSKFEAENVVRSLSLERNIKYTILRPPLVFGPGVKANFLSLMKILKWRVPLPLGSVENTRSLIYVNNLSGLIEKCMIHTAAINQVYVVKDITLSVPDLIRAISCSMGHEAWLFPFPVSLLRLGGSILGKRSMVDSLVDSLEINDEKIRKELDWHPTISFEGALQETVTWYLQEYQGAY